MYFLSACLHPPESETWCQIYFSNPDVRKKKNKRNPKSNKSWKMKRVFPMNSNAGDLSTINPRWPCSWWGGRLAAAVGRRTRGLTGGADAPPTGPTDGEGGAMTSPARLTHPLSCHRSLHAPWIILTVRAPFEPFWQVLKDAAYFPGFHYCNFVFSP